MTYTALNAHSQFAREMRVADTTASSLRTYRVSVPTPASGIFAVSASAHEEAEWNAAVLAADPAKIAAFKAGIRAQVMAGQTSVLRAEDF